MSHNKDSSSPSLLKSLIRFRFKKNILHDEKDDNSNKDNSNSDSSNSGNSTSTSESDLGNRACSNNNKVKKSDFEGDDDNDNDSCKSVENMNIIRKKKRLKIEDDSEDDTKGEASSVTAAASNDSDDESELVIVRKKKRLKIDDSLVSTSLNCDKVQSGSKSSDVSKNNVQKNIKDFLFKKQSSSNSVNNSSQSSKKINGMLESSDSRSSDNSDKSSKQEKQGTDDSGSDNEGIKSNTAPSISSSCSTKNDGSDEENVDDKIKKNLKKKKKSKKKTHDGIDAIIKESSVYDSDADSDEEVSNIMTGMKAKVFEFLNAAPEVELNEVKCTHKKIKALIEARPFNGWKHLVNTCEYNRSIGTDILNAVQDLLTARAVLADLMSRCELIAKKTENAVARGATNITEQPSLLTSCFQLKSYQMVGLNWLAVMHSQKISGILADEMGLGKTVQVIAFLAHLKEKGFSLKNCPHVIIVPTSTLENWSNEFERWCPNMKVVQYYGSQEERKYKRYNWIKYGFGDTEVVLSTYQVVSGSYEDKKLFRVVQLHYAIFDEGHMLKNMNSQRFENLFRINAKYRLLLTGTPIQNSLLELISLLMFVMPDMFATRTDYIKYLFEKRTKVQDKVKFERENVENVKRIMKPFMLRRLKQDVLQDLPTKTISLVECSLTESQAAKYYELLDQLQQSTSDPSLRTGNSYLGMFTDLRRMANHPLLLRYLYDDDKLSEMAKLLSSDSTFKENDEEKIYEDISYKSDHELHRLSLSHKCLKNYSLPDSVFLDSGKFNKLDELLPDLKSNNHRLLIFSQFIFVLDILEEYLRIRDYTYLRFDGSTSVFERQQLIDLYNMDENIFVFLLTTKSGGMGINLTSADTVIINDVDFNPYNDKQAEDRVHRMGQTRDVTIIRFYSKGTIEEAIMKIAQEKANLGQDLTAVNEDEAVEQKDMVSLLHSVLGLKA
ncbi:SWI/SNF-related, matrix-associated actin-dependent regulator of chromatin, subfamily a, containing DEAD/H box 1 [Lycorma delicatula]|uniref:SWI/SNF-related, matrix-associated actin-dependent regulator of chromatin, subfamily a, containing DEAD/H box 1 n=1 Tax=Lycorma delicatula TaxID=130591 RepID=UPI003F51A4EC